MEEKTNVRWIPDDFFHENNNGNVDVCDGTSKCIQHLANAPSDLAKKVAVN